MSTNTNEDDDQEEEKKGRARSGTLTQQSTNAGGKTSKVSKLTLRDQEKVRVCVLACGIPLIV